MAKCKRCPEQVACVNLRTGELYTLCQKCRIYSSNANKKYNASKPNKPDGHCKMTGCYATDCLINPATGKFYFYCEKCRTVRWRQQKESYKRNRKKHNETTSRQFKEWRRKAIDTYGGKCACCEEAEFDFLALDHINGDGHIERKLQSDHKTYRAAVLTYQPEKYRVLCHNCNNGYAIYGVCPHADASVISVFQAKPLSYNGSRYRKYRAKFFEIYGSKCLECGISNKCFLTLDHVQGGGNAHRAKRHSMGILIDACREYNPDLFQVLCWNCNSAKRTKAA